jgi:hypothetical protein
MNSETCTAPACTKPPTIRTPVLLCTRHQLEVAASVLPNMLATALAHEERDAEDGSATRNDAQLIGRSTAVPTPVDDKHPDVVYFAPNGGRIKIGYTGSLRRRLRTLSLRDDAVLLLLEGGESLERALHRKFAVCRIPGTEWFEMTPEILQFIADKRHQPTPVSTSTVIPQPRGPRRIRKMQEVQQVKELLAREGGEAVDIPRVMDELGLPRTTAYARLCEAKGQPTPWTR